MEQELAQLSQFKSATLSHVAHVLAGNLLDSDLILSVV